MVAGDVMRTAGELEEIEVGLLLEGINTHYGYDFRGYAPASLRRRLWHRAHAEGLPTISALQEKVLHDADAMQRLLVDVSVNVTAMFRDPAFYAVLRRTVIPLLRTYPFLRIWNAGCSTGEETYSLAIVLREEGLESRVRLYATDINDRVLESAQAGAFPLDRMQQYTQNYIQANGSAEFSSYYTVDGSWARFDRSLTKQMVFAQHNLVSDGPFNEFDLILCRNVLIYFAQPLKNRAYELFHDSLHTLGVLGLGEKESIKFSPHEDRYAALAPGVKLYRKTG
jgi:chemotaxis protein methyltransferase CheR